MKLFEFELNVLSLVGGGMAMLGVATASLVVLPYLLVGHAAPTPGLKPYTASQLRGRAEYISLGCLYCHSQQPRPRAMAPDFDRGWGRATVAGDYAFDQPHLLGTMRTGPDLMNIGVRQPSVEWHLGHLYQPRAYVPGSIMPAFPFLFDEKDTLEPGDVEVHVPPGYRPRGKILTAKPAALDLVEYLKSLDRSFPALEPEDKPASGTKP